MLDKPNILLCAFGSVAAVKVPELAVQLSSVANVRILGTKAAHHFIERAKDYSPQSWKEYLMLEGQSENGLLVTDDDEWQLWQKMGDPVLHIELRKWADLLLIAPASANMIAKASHGISDSLILSVLRAWDFSKPCVLCPAMNSVMWDHPVTAESLNKLRSWGYRIIDPVIKVLACNEKGMGAMASVADIVAVVKSALLEQRCRLKPVDVDIDSIILTARRASRKMHAATSRYTGVLLIIVVGVALLLLITRYAMAEKRCPHI